MGGLSVAARNPLRKPLAAPATAGFRVDKSDVDAAIRDHPEFQEYRQQVAEVFDLWRDAHAPFLRDLDDGDVPARVIDALSESLLIGFRDLPLINSYDVYQRLMDYWDDVMQDDVHLVVSDGWVEAAKPRAAIEDRHRQIKETPDLTVQGRRYKMDLVPPRLVVSRWFADEQAEVDALQATHATIARELEAFIEENATTATGDDGPLACVVNDSGRVTRPRVQARLDAVDPQYRGPCRTPGINTLHCPDSSPRPRQASALAPPKETLNRQVHCSVRHPYRCRTQDRRRRRQVV